MLFKWGFKSYPFSKKIDVLRRNGIMLGSRARNGRIVFLYMVKDFFVEVLYINDSTEQNPEAIETFRNLDNLNAYLEQEFRRSF